MTQFALNNKLTTKARFALRDFPGFDLVSEAGITPVQAVLEQRIGSEVALALIIKDRYIHQLAKVRPFDLRLTTGLVQTTYGPVAFLLFFVRNAADSLNPHFAHDYHLNPLDPGAVAVWQDLARQSHWHLLLVDANQQVQDVFEFENIYDLGDALDTFRDAAKEMRSIDFARAHDEFSSQYSIDDLLRLGQR